MKRSTIKPKRTRHRDTPESQEIRRTYVSSNQTCELSPLLQRVDVIFDRWADDTVQCHHVVAGNFSRVDVVSNLICVRADVHAWLHENPRDGLIACLAVKHAKGEVNAAEFRALAGQYLAGWLANNPPHDSRLEPYRQKLLASL